MEATRITQHGKIFFRTPTHAIETQQKLQAAGLCHVGKQPDRINENAVGLHWGDGLYFTTDRVEVWKRYPGPQYKQVEFVVDPRMMNTLSKEGHRTQKAMRAGLIAEITPLVVEAMNESLTRFPMMGRKRKINVEERRAGWKCFVAELKKRRDKYTLTHVRVVLKEHFPNVTQLYDSTFSAYYREVQ